MEIVHSYLRYKSFTWKLWVNFQFECMYEGSLKTSYKYSSSEITEYSKKKTPEVFKTFMLFIFLV